MSEKTEKATPKHLNDARKKGEVAKSKEIATCAVIVGLFGYFWFFFDAYLERVKHLMLLPVRYYHLPFDQAMMNIIKSGFQEAILLCLPLTIVVGMIAMLSYLAQIGFLVTFDPVKPDIKKIDPVQGFKRIFSLSNLLELGKSIIKILLLGFIIYILIKKHIKNLIHIPQGSPQIALEVLTAIMKKMTVAVSALFIVVAILDHFFQKHLHLRKMKMSKDDIKREYKDSEGDPHLKGQRQGLQREIAMDDNIGRISSSTVVIAQTGKLAVALYYKAGQTPLPILTIKGKNLAADKIAAVARKHAVPVISETGLVRRLYADCEQDNYIPNQHIEAVATILRIVIGSKNQS